MLTSQFFSSPLHDAIGHAVVCVDFDDIWWRVGHPFRVEEMQRFAAAANLVFANGEEMASVVEADLGVRALSLPNGVEATLWSRVHAEDFTKPSDFPETRGPVLLYTGGVNEIRFNTGLAKDVAARLHALGGWLLIIGHASAKAKKSLSLSNVRFLDPKPQEDLLAYMKWATALVDFFPLAHAAPMLPQKIMEYVATGKPVLTSQEAVAHLPGIAFAQMADDWIDAVVAVHSRPASQGAAAASVFVKANEWSIRARAFLDEVNKAFAGARGGPSGRKVQNADAVDKE